MKIKPKLLIIPIGLGSVSSIAYALQFNALVSKEYSNYVSSEVYESVEYTDWVNVGSLHSCGNFVPLVSEIYEGTSFQQSQECIQDQERIAHIYMINNETGEKTLKESKTEQRELKESITIDEVGTYQAISCLDIKNHHGDRGNGHYFINLPSGKEKVLCDMSTGGWTLLMSTGDDQGRPSMTSLVINKNNPPASANYSSYNYYPKMNDFFSIMNNETNFKFTCKDFSNGNLREYYHKNINNFNTYFNLDQGSYTGTITCSTNKDFTQNVKNDLFCVGGNDTNHRYYRASIEEYGWAHYNGNSTPKMLRHCGSPWYGDGTQKHNGYIWFK